MNTSTTDSDHENDGHLVEPGLHFPSLSSGLSETRVKETLQGHPKRIDSCAFEGQL